MGKLSEFQADPFGYWRRHPQGEMLLARGGHQLTPPLYANITLTNRCNLRCSICASQTTLDRTATPRRDMPLALFRQIERQFLPLLLVVELNSAGEPLLYPHFDEVLQALIDADCEVRLQTNATMFTARNLAKLCRLPGRVALSIDAVGPLFESLRCNGDWAKVDAGVRAYMAQRPPDQAVVVTATVTQRSLAGTLDLVRWAQDLGIPHVDLHLYNPLVDGVETRPDAQELRVQTERLVRWCQDHASPLMLSLSGRTLYRPAGFVMPETRLAYTFQPLAADAPYANPQVLCNAPYLALDIGLDGDIAPCCAGQRYPLGYVGEAEDLADLWFGQNLWAVRLSMRRGEASAFPYPACRDCVAAALPTEASRPGPALRSLRCTLDSVPLAGFTGGATADQFHARLPPGLEPERYRLYQGEREVSDWSAHECDITVRASGPGPFVLRRRAEG